MRHVKHLAIGLLLLASPAWAQLTPSAHILADCAEAKRYQPFASGPDSAAITAACGSPAAINATIAGGNGAMLGLKAVVNSARAAWKARIDAGTP